MKQQYLHIFLVPLLMTIAVQGLCQTFFESAEGDGVITFRRAKASQIKISPTSTAITYGYYTAFGSSAKKIRGLINIEAQAKPNSEGTATLIRSGKLQPGLSANGAMGIRFNDIGGSFFVLDIYAKPEVRYTSHLIYDTTRVEQGLDALYKKKKAYAGINVLVNGALSVFKTCNLFFGVQVGWSAASNVDDLNDITIQTTQSFIGQPNTQVKSSQISAKEGIYESISTTPFKVDLVFDTNRKLGSGAGSNTRIGIFTYFRNDLRYNKNQNRLGLGLCLLNNRDPSKVFTSLGYELPMFGKGVESTTSNDTGTVFVSIGYNLL